METHRTASIPASLHRASTLEFPARSSLCISSTTMATATKLADVAHKAVTTGLILTTLFGIADVTRGFSVLVQRNVDRRNPPPPQESETQAAGATSSEQ